MNGVLVVEVTIDRNDKVRMRRIEMAYDIKRES